MPFHQVVDAIIGAPSAPGPLSYFDFAPPELLGGELELAEICQPVVASGDGNEVRGWEARSDIISYQPYRITTVVAPVVEWRQAP